MATAPLKTKNDGETRSSTTAHAALHPPRKKRTVRKTGWREITLENGTVMIEKTPVEPKKTLKLRIYPNKNQKQRLKAWFEIHRLVYNRIVTCVNKQPTPCSVNLGMIALRKAVDTNNGAWPKLTGNNPAYKDAHSDL